MKGAWLDQGKEDGVVVFLQSKRRIYLKKNLFEIKRIFLKLLIISKQSSNKENNAFLRVKFVHLD